MPPKVKRIMTQPIVRLHPPPGTTSRNLTKSIPLVSYYCVGVQNLIFRFLQSRQKVQIWLYEQTDLRLEGRIIVSHRLHPLPSC